MKMVSVMQKKKLWKGLRANKSDLNNTLSALQLLKFSLIILFIMNFCRMTFLPKKTSPFYPTIGFTDLNLHQKLRNTYIWVPHCKSFLKVLSIYQIVTIVNKYNSQFYANLYLNSQTTWFKYATYIIERTPYEQNEFPPKFALLLLKFALIVILLKLI